MKICCITVWHRKHSYLELVILIEDLHVSEVTTVLLDECQEYHVSFLTLFFRCTSVAASGPYQTINNPGLVLLSRRPIRNMIYTDLHPNTKEMFERGVLQAEVGESAYTCTIQ